MQRRKITFTICLGLAVMLVSSAAMAQYQLRNLVSNQVKNAPKVDPLLVNAWGLAYGAGAPFWLSDTGSGWSTLYDGKGNKESLQVVIPSASGAGPGSPTGIVFNGSSDFQVGGQSAFFLFDSLDGTISAWAPGSNPNQAMIMVNNSATHATYTGLAVTSKASGNVLFAADVANNKVDIYDGTFTWVSSFTDSTLPAGFAPFGIQDINGLVYVAFGSFGQKGGFIDIFQEDGTFVKQFAQGKPLSNPWGFAVAPKNFGKLSNALLVSNNTKSGTINAFDITTGKYLGTVRDTNGKNIVIDELWGIEFGGGTAANGRTNQLFFTAGPHDYLAGTFGVINVK
jgi:uncharacterized protein (TIGR03118 family)